MSWVGSLSQPDPVRLSKTNNEQQPFCKMTASFIAVVLFICLASFYPLPQKSNNIMKPRVSQV